MGTPLQPCDDNLMSLKGNIKSMFQIKHWKINHTQMLNYGTEKVLNQKLVCVLQMIGYRETEVIEPRLNSGHTLDKIITSAVEV